MILTIKKYFNKYFENLVILFLSLTILPFLILSIFANPTYDDFWHCEITNEIGFWKSLYFWYTSWTGRYFSIAILSSVNPLIFKSIIGYKMMFGVLIILSLTLTYLLISEIFANILSKKEILISSLTFSSLYFYRMPSILGFYWMTASVMYEIPNILMMILFIFFLRFFKEENSNKKSLLGFFTIILILAVVGANETSMIILIEILLSIFLLNFFVYKKVNWQLFVFVFFSILGFCVNYFAPGNDVRLEAAGNSGIPHHLMYSIVNTASDLTRFIINRIVDTPILLFTILFIPLCVKIISSEKTDKSFISINPVYSVILFLILLASGYFTSYWNLGKAPPHWILNVIYFIFLAGWFINIFIIINFFKSKFDFRFYSLPKYALIILCVAIAFSTLKTSNIRTAYAELLNGTAYRYDEKQKERYRFINQSVSDTCVVDSIKNESKLLFFVDIRTDIQNPNNKYYAKYFNKKFIVLKNSSVDSSK